jgi:hypothetical protein
MLSLAWSRSESMAFAAHVGGTLGPEPACCSGVAKSDHADGYLVSGLGCSRRKAIAPLLGDVGMRSPFRIYRSWPI